eukprot:TRINITY_DN75696_c0_g1_i1.p1 TRINITY_DN75696_c0_g1~~TRINITY_DN75696_c0_g1_i1.p1  ORF type:complete len:562 (+),score=61.63 TRINITY_DN75696_c0_g1_i1:89-1774(+)
MLLWQVLAGHVVLIAVAQSVVEGEETCLLQAGARLVQREAVVPLTIVTNASLNASGMRQQPQPRTSELTNDRAALMEAAVQDSSNASNMQDALQGQESTAVVRSSSGSSVHPLTMFFVVLVGYAVLAVAYDACTPTPESEKKRVLEWDTVKLFVQVLIVGQHLQHMVMLDREWMERAGIGGSTIARTASMNYHNNSYLEYCVFFYAGFCRMPCFAFISGVFGQKVDRDNLLRVCCYTFGTAASLSVLCELLHILTFGHLRSNFMMNEIWYLVCLFWWRVSLAPLFDQLKDTSIGVRLFTFVMLSFVFYVCYDLFGAAMINAITVTNNWSPGEEYFSLGPFFALGVLMPTREWTALLLNKKLQILGCLVCAAYVGLPWNMTYRAWLDKYSLIAGHWPIEPMPSLAFTPARIVENAGWFAYKLMGTFGVIWFVAAITQPLCNLAPGISDRLLSGGARTMYSYTLHFPLMFMSIDLCNAGVAVQLGFPDTFLGSLQWCLTALSIAMFVVLVLTSRLTEKLTHQMVMPFWILQVPAMVGLSFGTRKDKQGLRESVVGEPEKKPTL